MDEIYSCHFKRRFEMKLSLSSIQNRDVWTAAGIVLPAYDVESSAAKAKAAPRWVHFGIGNIFRVFIGGIADNLLEAGVLDRGITCIEPFDFDVVDKIYRPFDNLALSVILHSDGKRDIRVLGFGAEAVKARSEVPKDWNRMKEIFRSPDLQIVSFTVTEKGYALKDPDGAFLPHVKADLEGGPDRAVSVIPIVTAMLNERFLAGGQPVALVSMDNCSHNGELLRHTVLTVAEEWKKRNYITEDFYGYVRDEGRVAFPWTMIDKITPRPSSEIATDLEALGMEDMQPLITGKRTYIAPFANAEGPQYLVIEDSFPNGRPGLERGRGVYLADRKTVNLAERMKVTACLNPVHSALGPIGVVYGIDLFADLLDDAALLELGKTVAYREGMPVIEDPGIISPEAFADELFNDRFPNRYLGDTNLRLCTDITQGFSVRFGETIKSYVVRDGSAAALSAIPFGIAGCMRYALGIDDHGNAYELAPDPLIPGIHERLSDVEIGKPESYHGQLRLVLSNENIFGIDLFEAGIGERIEEIFVEMIAGPGACRKTVESEYLGTANKKEERLALR